MCMECAMSKQENPTRPPVWPMVLVAAVIGVGAAFVIDWVMSGGLGPAVFVLAALWAVAVTLRVVAGLLAAVFR